jgi:PIN domain nuclease of toxin-antitoxin system
LRRDLSRIVASQGFEPLPVSFEDGQAAGRLRGPHRDPFDRTLIAQCLSRDVPLVSVEHIFDAYGVRRVW